MFVAPVFFVHSDLVIQFLKGKGLPYFEDAGNQERRGEDDAGNRETALVVVRVVEHVPILLRSLSVERRLRWRDCIESLIDIKRLAR